MISNHDAQAVRTARTNTLRDIADQLDRADRLDRAALELPEQAGPLRYVADGFRQIAALMRGMEGSLAEVVDLLNAAPQPEPEPRTINEWLARKTDAPGRWLASDADADQPNR